jgi:hypothetical protein
MIRIILATSLLIASAVAAFGGEVKGTNGDHSNPTPPAARMPSGPEVPGRQNLLVYLRTTLTSKFEVWRNW